jgi:hypothetical protein
MSVILPERLIERVELYAEQNDNPTVPEALGRFLIDPAGPESEEERTLVKEVLTADGEEASHEGDSGSAGAEA